MRATICANAPFGLSLSKPLRIGREQVSRLYLWTVPLR